MSPEIQHDAHIWLVCGVDLESGPLDDYLAVLSTAEKEKAARYRIAGDQRRSILGRALARWALAARTGTSPESIQIEISEQGRPEAPDLGLHFSVSHTHGLVGVAVSDVEIGFDSEWLGRGTDIDLVARRWFHPDEVADILASEGPEQRRRFFTYWTLKEAYCKALGLGLSIPLRSLRFDVDERIRLARDDESTDGWTFWNSGQGADHVISVAAATTSLAVSLREVPGPWRPSI